MANICSFSMMVVGNKKENLETFLNMLTQNGDVYMGRGANVYSHEIEDVSDNYEKEKYRMQIEGDCKWAIESALIRNAISMREDPDKWYFGDKTDITKLRFVTLFEACKELDVNMEVFSNEPGCGFEEHILYQDGYTLNETCDYTETFNEDSQEWGSEGGYEWDFEVC